MLLALATGALGITVVGQDRVAFGAARVHVDCSRAGAPVRHTQLQLRRRRIRDGKNVRIREHGASPQAHDLK